MITETEIAAFEDPVDADDDGQLLLDLDGYGGPIDVLLSLARDQKVDLTKISILALVEPGPVPSGFSRKLIMRFSSVLLPPPPRATGRQRWRWATKPLTPPPASYCNGVMPWTATAAPNSPTSTP